MTTDHSKVLKKSTGASYLFVTFHSNHKLLFSIIVNNLARAN